MKKLLLLVVSVVMLAGWRSFNGSSNGKRADLVSPKDVAEDFVNAIVQRDLDKAFEFYDPFEESGRRFVLRPRKQRDNIKKKLEDLGHELNAEKLECEAILEDIVVPPEFYGYHLVNGKKYTGETARVLLQFVKGDAKKSDGLEIALVKVDDSWKVAGYELKSGLDTSSEDSDREYKAPASKPQDEKEAAKKEPNRVREYERICREFASLMKREGREISEDDIEEEIEKFKKYSSEKQKEEIENAERLLKKKRDASRAEAKDAPKMDSPQARPYSGKYERLRKFERLCREAAALMKGDGQEIAEEDVEKEIEKFKDLSEEKQEAELKEAEEMLEYLKKASRAKAAKKDMPKK